MTTALFEVARRDAVKMVGFQMPQTILSDLDKIVEETKTSRTQILNAAVRGIIKSYKRNPTNLKII